MRNIWIDGYEANVAQRVGSGQIGVELIRALSIMDRDNQYTVVLPTVVREDMPNSREGWKYKVLRPSKLWTWIALPVALTWARPRPEVVFSPTHYIPRVKGFKRVVMIFDLAYLKYPQFFLSKDLYKLRNWTKYSITHADHIITISKSTKKDIQKEYGIDQSKITVAYPGYDNKLFRPIRDRELIDKVLNKYKIEGKYLIYIGTIQPRKNLIKLMEVVSQIPDIKLVIVGKAKGEGREGWMFEETINYPNKLEISDRVIFTGFVDREELPVLLSGAECYVLPSLYEGFGMPVLDAMATGVPVVVSNTSSLPEVVGKSGLLVDPEKNDEIEQAIRLLLTDNRKRQQLIRTGLAQASKFSWEKMGLAVKGVLDTV